VRRPSHEPADDGRVDRGREHDNGGRLRVAAGAGRLDAPVELATSPTDKYFPLAESCRLAARSQQVRVTVTSSLSHAIPEPSLGSLSAALAFDGSVVRGLGALNR
jgi:hypothetical protein